MSNKERATIVKHKVAEEVVVDNSSEEMYNRLQKVEEELLAFKSTYAQHMPKIRDIFGI